jgi:hypothetical protein
VNDDVSTSLTGAADDDAGVKLNPGVLLVDAGVALKVKLVAAVLLLLLLAGVAPNLNPAVALGAGVLGVP